MRTIAFTALMMLVSANALIETTDLQQGSDAVEAVLNAIERLRQKIKDDGYDPYYVEKAQSHYYNYDGFEIFFSLEDFEFTGASYIVVNDVSHSLITNKLSFDVSIPELRVAVGDAGTGVSINGGPRNNLNLSGRLGIVDIGLIGEFNVDIDDDLRVEVSDLVVVADLGSIESDIHVNLMGWDLSSYFNNIINNKLPSIINNKGNLINRIIERVMMYFINRRD